MDGGLSPLRATAFYTMAAKYRIASYHNLRRNRAAWRRWLSNQGPILAREPFPHLHGEPHLL